MKRLKKILEKPFVLPLTGLILGLVVLGWWLWPVEWVDASPSQLQNEYKRDYMCMVIDSYVRNHDEDLVNKRIAVIGDDAASYVEMLTPELCKFATEEEIVSFLALKFPDHDLAATSEEAEPVEELVVEEDPQESSPFLRNLLYAVVVIGALGGAGFILHKRGKLPFPKQAPKRVIHDGFVDEVSPAATQETYQEPPLAQFMTTYRIGDDLYDDSFSIDSATGEFLGECGVGITETIGVGDPKKVNSLEIWLFDKNDIQTITKVLLSEHAFNELATRQRLAAKGETILVEPGQRFVMETATLQLEAHVVDMVYARSPLPENSHFSRLTLEIAVWNKM